MPLVKSPCIDCNLLAEDKNNPTCEACSKRIDYVAAIGGLSYSLPVELTDLIPKKGFEMELQDDRQLIVKTEELRLCVECKEKPTIRPNSMLCASCMAKRSHRNRKSPESAFEAGKKEKAYADRAKANMSPRGLKETVTVEFKGHISILKEVEKLADQELRPLDCQILYILKKYIEASGSNGHD